MAQHKSGFGPSFLTRYSYTVRRL